MKVIVLGIVMVGVVWFLIGGVSLAIENGDFGAAAAFCFMAAVVVALGAAALGQAGREEEW
jgi:hypothetical protein